MANSSKSKSLFLIQELPKGEDVVFDVEVLYEISPYPVLAIAASEHAW
jgi:DNA mitochondrial polymerase exonuclease domain